jgi:hypothetical protein
MLDDKIPEALKAELADMEAQEQDALAKRRVYQRHLDAIQQRRAEIEVEVATGVPPVPVKAPLTGTEALAVTAAAVQDLEKTGGVKS